MKRVTIIATSLNADSKSQILAEQFEGELQQASVEVERFDLRQMDIPFSGTAAGWSSPPDVAALQKSLEASSHIVFAVPIYCYDVNSAAKNVIELIGRSFTRKVVSFICAAGGSGSYMSVMGMANHLMLDFRCVIVPRFLYAESSHWSEDGSLAPEISERLARLKSDMAEISVAPVSKE
ncbi:MAG: NAD(P)H-dependent oxidoreductase [Verrucomicrobiota bacterium]